MTEVKFISFGGPSSNYHRAVNRIIHEANNTKLFTSVKGYTDIDLKNDNIFWSNHGKFLENNKRGYGNHT
jgi:beta-galactosidase beta subunit